MIVIDNNFRSQYRSAVRKARAERIRTVRLESNLYYVSRREKGHGRYLVKFIEEPNGTVTAECRMINGWKCSGTLKRGSCCLHIASAVLRALEYGRRKNESEAA